MRKNGFSERAQRLNAPEDGAAVRHFFFKAGNMEQTRWKNAVCSLLYQLLEKQRCLCDSILRKFRVKGKLKRLLEDDVLLWANTLSIYLEGETRGYWNKGFFIIDGLDEGETEGVDQGPAALCLKKFLSYKEEHETAGLRIMITERPNTNIQNRFSLSLLILRGEDESASLAADSLKVINQQTELFGRERHLSPLVCELLKKRLIADCGSSLLWVSLAFKVLFDLNNYLTNWPFLEKTLDEISGDLKKLYLYALSHSPDIFIPKTILYCILAAWRPLTPTEINTALNIEPGVKTRSQLQEERLISQIEAVIRSHCGVSISIANEKIYLIHETARRFLLDWEPTPNINWEPVTMTRAHGILAKSSILYLQLPVGDNFLFDPPYFSKYWMDYDLESRKVTDDPDTAWDAKYQLSIWRPLDEQVMALCDPKNNACIRWKSRYGRFIDAATTDCWISVIMGIIRVCNRAKSPDRSPLNRLLKKIYEHQAVALAKLCTKY
ncbi:hypothetical protein TWF970_000756 [Orbilia oligospora]|uniref:NACHT domain-containing protein n=1 Tax=Orbilia oligospora TaxID=2813651 RepID=A0A7C8RIN2_ORBOL|nr:hypothetical protein TWF970_000756 [Orbilia oligospora]